MVTYGDIKLMELKTSLLQLAAERTPLTEDIEKVMINAHILYHFVGLPCFTSCLVTQSLKDIKPAGSA